MICVHVSHKGAEVDNDKSPVEENAEANNASLPQEEKGRDQTQRKKRRRVRVKKVREDIKQQMEFYFCDANLR